MIANIGTTELFKCGAGRCGAGVVLHSPGDRAAGVGDFGRSEDAIELALAHRRDQRMPIPEDRAPTLRKVSVAAA